MLQRHVGHALDVGRLGHLEERGHFGDGCAAGRVNQLRLAVAGRLQLNHRVEPRSGLLKIGRVAADRAACDQVFAGVGVDHELLRLRAAHGAGVGLDGDELQAAAGEDLAVDRIVQIEALVQAGLVDVEGIAVLHGELAHAQQAGLGPRLVAELGLNLVPDLRQLLVAAQFAAGDGGHDLFVRHAQAEIGALAVLEAEHVVAHARPAAALLPRLAGKNGGQVKLLADPVHLLAHDADDLVQRALAEEEVVVNARAELADVAGAEQKLVAGHFGVCRGLAKSGMKSFDQRCIEMSAYFPVRQRRTQDKIGAVSILNVRGQSDSGVNFHSAIQRWTRQPSEPKATHRRELFISVPGCKLSNLVLRFHRNSRISSDNVSDGRWNCRSYLAIEGVTDR